MNKMGSKFQLEVTFHMQTYKVMKYICVYFLQLVGEITMISEGGDLLDLDSMHNQQNNKYMDPPSPLSYQSPDVHGMSFYPESLYPQQPMGSSIDDYGETDMVWLLMREMIPDILADCEKLNLHPSKYPKYIHVCT